MVTTFKLPDKKPFAMERIDALCRDLTNATGLAFVVWDGEGRFWMPVGFSATLTGLIVGSDGLRERMLWLVQKALAGRVMVHDEIVSGVQCLTLPVNRRQRPELVMAAGVLTAGADADRAALELGQAAGVSQDEARQRLSGEPRFLMQNVVMVGRLIGRVTEGYVQSLDAEDAIQDMGHKLAQGYEEITLYQRMASKIRVSQPSESFFLATCSELLEFLDVEGLAALYHEKHDGKSAPRVVSLGDLPLEQDRLVELYRRFERDLRDGREAVIVNEMSASPETAALAPGARNMILVPLRQGKSLYGVMAAFNKRGGAEFYSTDVKLVASVSGTIAVFVENSCLYDQLQDLMLGTIRAMVSSIDAKDPYTCGHSERVALISKRLAQQMGLPRETVDRIYLAGLLHDIGKIGVPERILLKNGRLDADEFDMIKTHTTIGARILAGVRELESVIPGVLHHHERLDGRGYPHGLNEGNLPLEGRIIGLADALDAMTSNRVYRSAMPLEEVEKEIRRCTGVQFDSRCVDALLEIGIGPLLESLAGQGQELSLELDRMSWRKN